MPDNGDDLDWLDLKGPTHQQQLLEVSVFLFLIVPSMVLSFFLVRVGQINFVLAAISTILRDLALVSLILYFIWRNGEALQRLGLTWRNAGREVILGALLFVPIFFGAGVLEHFLRQIGFSVPATPLPKFLTVQGPGEVILAFFLVIIIALAEETIFRGYLILRFRGLKATPLAAALLSAVVFSLGHGYEGTAGVVTVGALGLVLALIYQWRGSLTAPIVIHFFQDFSSIVLPAMLGK
jgi:membrane protease YdiL (CAAX protease family)